MKIIQGTIRVEAGTRDTFLAESVENMRITRQEPGCLEYVLAPDPVDDDRVVLSERWESGDDLKAHGAAAAKRRQEAAERGEAPTVRPVSIEATIFEVASSRPLF